jgi:hypothetical protein
LEERKTKFINRLWHIDIALSVRHNKAFVRRLLQVSPAVALPLVVFAAAAAPVLTMKMTWTRASRTLFAADFWLTGTRMNQSLILQAS